MYMAYRVNEKVYLGLVKIVNEKADHGSGAVNFPICTLFAAKVCPVCLCLGTLLLLVGAFL